MEVRKKLEDKLRSLIDCIQMELLEVDYHCINTLPANSNDLGDNLDYFLDNLDETMNSIVEMIEDFKEEHLDESI